MHKDLKIIRYHQKDIVEKILKMGAEISKDYAGQELLLVGVLKGSVVFMSDLMRAIEGSVSIDFMAVSSYGKDAKSSGVVKILKDLDNPIEGKNILIVEDILDSGRTLRYIIDLLATRSPASVKVCAFLDKPGRRVVDVSCDYRGFTIDDPNAFIVGYGLDYNEKYRSLPYVAELSPEVYTKE